LTTILNALAASSVALGHSWAEQLRNIDANGNYVGQYGYPRGYLDRGTPEFAVGDGMTWRMPPSNGEGKVFITADQPLCAPNQRERKQISEKFPRLKAVPGGFIAMRYQENGHVTGAATNPDKPEKGGTVYVYGTTDPKSDEKLVDVLQWTQDGQGGDKRGVLLAMNDYDDGRCYLNNDSPVAMERKKTNPAYAMGSAQSGPSNTVMFCETDVKLPDTVQIGEAYTLYWVWQWVTLPNKIPGLPDGKDEYYSTCIDVDMASADVATAAEDPSELNKFAMAQQDAVTAALSDWASRTALFTDMPSKREFGPVFSELPNGGGSGGDAPAPTASAPISSAAPSISSAAPPAATSAPPTPSSAPSALSSALPTASSSGAALSSSAVFDIPTLSERPGAAPTSVPGDSNIVTVTDVVMVTVTATAETQPVASAVVPRAA
ncbi:hypothetical protein BDW02DRAFT_471297, partial [Decorospora gaudefroyi]